MIYISLPFSSPQQNAWQKQYKEGRKVFFLPIIWIYSPTVCISHGWNTTRKLASRIPFVVRRQVNTVLRFLSHFNQTSTQPMRWCCLCLKSRSFHPINHFYKHPHRHAKIFVSKLILYPVKLKPSSLPT